MKKRILKIAAFVFAIALIAGVCVFANALVGNPISKAMATNTAEKHIEEYTLKYSGSVLPQPTNASTNVSVKTNIANFFIDQHLQKLCFL